MSKDSNGEKAAAAADGDVGSMIVAVFPTTNGNFKYVVDMEEFNELQKLVAQPSGRT